MPIGPEEDRHYYQPLFDMFQTRGWHVLLQDMEEAVEDLNRIDNVKTVEELHHLRGMVTAYRRMLVYQESIERQYEQEENSDAEDI